MLYTIDSTLQKSINVFQDFSADSSRPPQVGLHGGEADGQTTGESCDVGSQDWEQLQRNIIIN